MKKRKITISDVAREMRVSVTTVSFVLNGKAEGRVSPQVTRRILAYADRVGYRPNALSRRKQRNQMKLYGVLVDDVRNPFQRDLVFHLQRLLSANGAAAVIMSINGEQEQAFSLAKALGSLELSGYFFMALPQLDENVKRETLWRGPVVLWGGEWSDAVTVRPDYAVLLQPLLLEAVQSHALDRVALLCCGSDPATGNSFVSGYMSAMDHLQGDVLVKKLPFLSSDAETKAQLVGFLQNNKVDTLVFSNDRLARLAVQVLKAENVQIRCVVSPSHVQSDADPSLLQITLPLDAEHWAGEIVGNLIL